MDILSWEHQNITTDTLIKDMNKAVVQPLELTGDHCVLCNKDTKSTTLARAADHALHQQYGLNNMPKQVL